MTLTPIERLRLDVAYLNEPNRTPDKALMDYSWQPCYAITAGDARALLALVEAGQRLVGSPPYLADTAELRTALALLTTHEPDN